MESVLESILINTYNIDGLARKQAEEALKQFLTNQGALLALVNYIGNVNNHRELRQATAIVIKNKLRDLWSPENGTAVATAEEKDVFKSRLIEILLVELDNSIRGILAEAVRIVSESEFPDNWPTLIPTILTCIQSPDVLRMYNALLALRKVAKRYEYKQSDSRKPLDDIVQVSFPALQQLVTNISNLQSIEAAQVMKMCLKIFHSATLYQLPNVQGVDVNFWFQAIAHILNKPLHEAAENIEPLGQPIELEERPSWPWWKLKKWAARIVKHFIQRYGNPNYADDKYKQFATYFREHTASLLLAPVMNILASKAKGAYVTEDVHRQCIEYVAACVEMSPTYKVLKPHMQFIVVNVVFPTLCVTDADISLFAEEPVEFVRKVHDPMGDWTSPLVAATNLLQMLSRYRQKDTLPVVLPFIESILNEYTAAAPEVKSYKKKDGALVAIAVLAKILRENKTYKPMLAPFLQMHVIPEFQSAVPFIRSRACWVIEYFHELDWSSQEEGGGGALLQQVLSGLINSLRDPALPVQAAAACSLRLLIEADGATDLLRPMLGDIVAEYFRIMQEVENESVLSALQTIILNFGEDVAGMAPMMATHLVAMFGQFLAAGGDDEEATFNAVQCLDTIDSVLEAVQELPPVLAQVEPIIQPVLMKLLVDGEELFEYIDTAVHMISSLTYYGEAISPYMWELCGPLLHVLHDWAYDYIGEMMVPILNFMTKDISLFLAGSYKDEPFVETMLKVASKTFSNDESDGGHDSSAASTMLTCLITSCRIISPSGNAVMPKLHPGLVPLLPRVFQICLERLGIIQPTASDNSSSGGDGSGSLEKQRRHRRTSSSLRTRLLEVVLSGIYYDASTSLGILLSASADTAGTVVSSTGGGVVATGGVESVAHGFFSLLFNSLADFNRDISQRIVVLAFTAILSSGIPMDQLPDILRNNLQSMFQQIIRELVMIEETVANGGDDDDDEDGDGMGDDDDEDSKAGNDDDDDDDDEDGGDYFDDADARQAAINRAKKLYVPEGGYDEDQDCLNAEDEAYREALEELEKKETAKKQKQAAAAAAAAAAASSSSGGVGGAASSSGAMSGFNNLVGLCDDDEDDDEEEDFAFTSPIENMNITQYFLDTMNSLAHRDAQSAQITAALQGSLSAEDNVHLQNLVKIAQEKEREAANATAATDNSTA